MTAFLDERLDQPQLGPLDIVSAFGCSRATIHRLFTIEGGVRTYVRNQRLAQCFEELAMNPLPGRYIYEVAERWGFNSAAHFSRAFRNRYGLNAQQLYGSALKDFSGNHHISPDSPAIDQIHRWLS